MGSICQYDVIILGAGVAGLRTAELLLQTDKSLNVLVLEARDRVGGRTNSFQHNNHSYDIGGQWVSPHQKNVMTLIDEIGLETYSQNTNGTKVMEFAPDNRQTFSGFIPPIGFVQALKLQFIFWKLEYMMRQVPDMGVGLDLNKDYSKAREWDKISCEQWINDNIASEDLKNLFRVSMSAIFCEHPKNISLLFMLMAFKSIGGIERALSVKGGAQEKKIYNSAYQIAMFLEKRVNELSQEPRAIRFNHTVSRVSDYDSYPVKVECDNGESFTCKYLVSTIPPPLCKEITYNPPLPKARQTLIDTASMGKVIKFLVFYESNLWAHHSNITKYSGEVISFGPGVSFVYDATLENGSNPCIVGFFVGENALNWSKKRSDERKTHVTDFLFKTLGDGKDSRYLNPSEYIECDWSKEEFSKGGYSIVIPNKTSFLDYKDSLFKFIGRMHFAGSETAKDWVGYIDGAVGSAERVANEVLYQINPCKETKVKTGVIDYNDSAFADDKNQKSVLSTIATNYKHIINVGIIFIATYKVMQYIAIKD
ncbi:hypothetical protein CYY_005127 [Polysphondylium violaceum]|uniref:Amine oxidase n=1 Tax=Polysphondylium violaceum TaxID=133409 RepID=A0A8J4PSA2_9MYCE|nr:hypothetical protein CYY_005127 [Polysphondylium violaceum]